jgi:hypothetical protein
VTGAPKFSNGKILFRFVVSKTNVNFLDGSRCMEKIEIGLVDGKHGRCEESKIFSDKG